MKMLKSEIDGIFEEVLVSEVEDRVFRDGNCQNPYLSCKKNVRHGWQFSYWPDSDGATYCVHVTQKGLHGKVLDRVRLVTQKDVMEFAEWLVSQEATI